MSTLKVNNLQTTSGGSNSTPEEINQGRAKAWCNFQGTGTVSIRDSYNINSITDRGTGKYTLSFSSAMANTNYASVFGANANTAGYAGAETQNTGTLLCFGSYSGQFYDISIGNVAVFGD
jgi:hypothetical protein|tara:strand:- start:1037 stop:1396 length:360 start_codon:yes stop_codon:yes gene_type:complete